MSDEPAREELFGYIVEAREGDGMRVEALVASGVEVIAGELEQEALVVPMVGLAFNVQAPTGARAKLSPVLMTPDQARAVAVQLVDSANICDQEES